MQISASSTTYAASQAQRALSMLLQQQTQPAGQELQGADGASKRPGARHGPPPAGGASDQFASRTLSSLLSAQEQPASSSDVAASLISSADKDGDGLLSADELAAATGADPSQATDALSAAIGKLDSDGDGKLSATELSSGLDAAHAAHAARHAHGGRPPSSDDMAAKLLGDADSDGDGSLSTDELAAKLADGSSDSIASAMGKLDTDGDGKLSAAELSAALDAFRSADARSGSYGQSGAQTAQASAIA